MTDSPVRHYRLDARRPVSSRYRTSLPSLHARCADGDFDFYLATGQVLSSDSKGSLLIRLDDAPAELSSWTEGTSHDTVFAVAARDLAERLLKARTLRIELVPHDSPPVVAVFDVTGFQRVARSISAACAIPVDETPAARRVRLAARAEAEAKAAAERRARMDAESARWREEQAELMRRATEERRIALAKEAAAEAAKTAADEEARARAVLVFDQLCGRTATRDGLDMLRGCVPSADVCVAVNQAGLRLSGCPGTALEFTAMSILPRGDSKPRLVFACVSGAMAATMYPGLPLQPGATHLVRVKWGAGGRPTTEEWSMGNAERYINSPHADALAAAIDSNQLLAIEVTPAGNVPFAAEFNLGASASRGALKRLRELCSPAAVQ